MLDFELQFYFLDRFGSTWRKREEKGGICIFASMVKI